MAKVRTIQIEDGKWYRLGMHASHACCDCELHHSIEYKIEKGVIFERWTRDEKATNKVRKDAGIKVTRDESN